MCSPLAAQETMPRESSVYPTPQAAAVRPIDEFEAAKYRVTSPLCYPYPSPSSTCSRPPTEIPRKLDQFYEFLEELGFKLFLLGLGGVIVYSLVKAALFILTLF